MPQQLLITLPSEASSWVKLNHLEKTKEARMKMYEGEGENRQMRVGRGGPLGTDKVCVGLVLGLGARGHL